MKLTHVTYKPAPGAILNGTSPVTACHILGGGCEFITQDGEFHQVLGRWDLLIAHPPCTDLANSGARHFAKKIADGRQQRSVEFFMKFTTADCDRIAIENPIGIMSSLYRKPDQIIQPYWFGDPAKKSTCLWLKNLPLLVPTDTVEPDLQTYTRKSGKTVTFSADYGKGGKERKKLRSKTYWGIAKAMAEQWG